jgi:hypothetical protein
VQDGRLHRGRRSGAGAVKLRGGGGLLLLLALLLLLLALPPVRRRRERKAGRQGFRGAARTLIPGARAWEWLRPGVLDGRAGTCGGIAAARASRARAAVKARWKGGAGGCALLS